MVSEDKLTERTPPAAIVEDDFRNLIAGRTQTLLGLAGYMSRAGHAGAALTRPVAGDMLAQATLVEELLDSYGASTNRRWCALRSLTAAIKLFAEVGYELLHIRHALPSYQLLEIEEHFPQATEDAIAFTAEILRRASVKMLVEAGELKLPTPPQSDTADIHEEMLSPGRLPRDRDTRTIENAPEIVTRLATAFLSLAAESDSVHVAARAAPEEYASCFPDPVSEETLRFLQDRFHNLQSLYDTYVSDTRTEHLDPGRPVLRGHVSAVFHLLKTATALAHYYERHVNLPPGHAPPCREPVITPDELLGVLMNYSSAFASRYLTCGTQLCQGMLNRYAEVSQVEVPLPRYRGFHVRPSTLIAKIVRHYGSEVRMHLESEVYDAGSPLEIFRANEKINAQKRAYLASEIARLRLVPNGAAKNFAPIVRGVVMTLAEMGRVVLYEKNFQPLKEPTVKEGPLLEQVIDEVARLQATGQIDIRADLNVTFIGDKRALADIKLLAEGGYGEDNLGNNVPLPK